MSRVDSLRLVASIEIPNDLFQGAVNTIQGQAPQKATNYAHLQL